MASDLVFSYKIGFILQIFNDVYKLSVLVKIALTGIAVMHVSAREKGGVSA